MARQRKRIREKGKIKLSHYFKKIDDGVDVAVVTDVGVRAMFPKRLKGMNGKVVGSRGKFKLVQIKTGDKMKTFINSSNSFNGEKMTIKEETPITMAEVVALAGDSEKGKAIKKFIKNFNKMDVEKTIEMKKELEALNLIKLKDAYIVKIIDFMPTDASELNKVVVDVSLDEEEINKILEVIKKY